MVSLPSSLRLIVVTDAALLHGRDAVAVCAAAVRGGATSIQLRDKRATARALFALGRRLVDALPVPVLINDRLDVALAAGAAGCHLGSDDFPARSARGLVPAGFLLGASVGSAQEVESQWRRDADYWGIGPCYRTATKANAGEPLGPLGFSVLQRQAGGVPCVGIGGIRADNAAAVIAAGASGVAVVSAVMGARDPESAARALRAAIDRVGCA